MTLIQVSPPVMVTLLGVGATVVAVWFYVRFPRTAPTDMTRLLTHLILAGLLIQFVVPPALAITGDGSALSRLAGIFGFGFTALVYCLLTVLWLLGWATQMLARHR